MGWVVGRRLLRVSVLGPGPALTSLSFPTGPFLLPTLDGAREPQLPGCLKAQGLMS